MILRWRIVKFLLGLVPVSLIVVQLQLWWMTSLLSTSQRRQVLKSFTQLPELVHCESGTAQPQRDLSQLLRQMVLDDQLRAAHWLWLRHRLQQLWPAWTRAIRHLVLGYSRKQVLVVPGVLLATNFAEMESIRNGGPLGDLVQWTDLIAGLHLLGHNVTVMKDIYQAARGLRYSHFKWAMRNGCIPSDFDLIYVDIISMKAFPKDVLHNYRCKFRVLDAYGTEAMYNDEAYSKKLQLRNAYGNLGLNLQQFLTFYPHSPDNSFLGFVVRPAQMGKHLVKENIGVLYGKDANYFKAKTWYIQQLQQWMSIHSTVKNASGLPAGVVNHGVVTPAEYHQLLSRAKFFIGVGLPLESTGVMEALAYGCVFLNPAFTGHERDILQAEGKPTSRKMSSQVPYLEHFVQAPHVYTIHTDNAESIRTTLQNIYLTAKVSAYLPFEFSMAGFLQRLSAYVDNQDFCSVTPGHRHWPPLSALTTVIAKENVSCSTACHEKAFVCEPSFFPHLNDPASFHRHKLQCNRYPTISDVYLPAFHRTRQLCALQGNVALFSCSATDSDWSRLCPCRDYIHQQVALCKQCL